MPQRAWGLAIAGVGVLFVLTLILLGIDLAKSAGGSPRRRTLVAAGALLLASLGFGFGCSGKEPAAAGGAAKPSKGGQNDPAASKELSQTPEWKRITVAWREAEVIASGARGAYPFNEPGKKLALQSLSDAAGGVDALQKAGSLSDPEVGLLKEDLKVLSGRVSYFRTKEMERATCYEPMMIDPVRDSATRLSTRLPLLEKLAEQQTLHPQALSKVLQNVEQDMAVLTTGDAKKGLADDQRKLAANVSAALERIRANAGSGAVSLEGLQDWRIVDDAWKTAVPLAERGKSATKQRDAAREKLRLACDAADRLAVASVLRPAEAGLLASEADKLDNDIYRNSPTDPDPAMSCYTPAAVVPAKNSLQRIAVRLPLLQQLGDGGVVHREAMEKVMASIEADLKELSNKTDLAALPNDERLLAERQRDEARMALAKIKSKWIAQDASH